MRTLKISGTLDLRAKLTAGEPSVCVYAGKGFAAAFCEGKFIRLIFGDFSNNQPTILNEVKYYSGVDQSFKAASVAITDNKNGILAFCQQGKVVVQNFTLLESGEVEYGEVEALADGKYVTAAARGSSEFGLVIVYSSLLFRSYAGKFDAASNKVVFKTEDTDRYDTGYYPKLTFDKKYQAAFEIHEGGNSVSHNRTWYHYAAFYGNFVWDKVFGFTTDAERPCIGILNNSGVCALYEREQGIYYGMGTFDSRTRTVSWTAKETALCRGGSPNAAFYGDEGVLLYNDLANELQIAYIACV